jgi:inhibitor of KinA
VCYGGAYGPDLDAVAAFAGCASHDVVQRHAAPTYRVYMLGFLPGFAYLGSVDARLAMPRRTAPRARVPAGSVGIAGLQTGVYPCDSPGGWQLVGRTPWRMFDVARSEPALLRAGDLVEFVPLPHDQWDTCAGGPWP